jgi:hypothetical protein
MEIPWLDLLRRVHGEGGPVVHLPVAAARAGDEAERVDQRRLARAAVSQYGDVAILSVEYSFAVAMTPPFRVALFGGARGIGL